MRFLPASSNIQQNDSNSNLNGSSWNLTQGHAQQQPSSSLSSPCASTSGQTDCTTTSTAASSSNVSGLTANGYGHKRSSSASLLHNGHLIDECAATPGTHHPTALCTDRCVDNRSSCTDQLLPVKQRLLDLDPVDDVDLESGGPMMLDSGGPPSYTDAYTDDPLSDSTGCTGKSPDGDSRSSSAGASFFLPAAFCMEKKRAALAFLLAFLAGLSNDLVLAFIHERVPETEPLPDIVFAHTPYVPWALTVSELCIILNAGFAFTIIALNRHRFTLLKRMMLVSSFLYGGRALCMLVTQVPVADTKYYCSPKMNETSFSLVFGRALSLVSGLGLSWSGKHVLCGDYIYSGHTLVLVHTYLVVKESTPKRWYMLHWWSALQAAAGVACLLLSRGHYTVDVLIAYWVTTRVFAMYHTSCSHAHLREYTHRNHLSRLCWFPIMRWFEDGVPSTVPLVFEWPLPWPAPRQQAKTNIY